MVYEAEKIETKYSVKKDDVTVVFFENGKEKNRLPVDSSLDLQTMLIPALNQLPLSNVGQSIQPPATPAQTTQQSTTSQSNAEQETGQSVEGETVAE
nr:hypothetical protein A5880_001278 [Enterococcus sp. 4G2_DIV0659]